MSIALTNGIVLNIYKFINIIHESGFALILGAHLHETANLSAPRLYFLFYLGNHSDTGILLVQCLRQLLPRLPQLIFQVMRFQDQGLVLQLHFGDYFVCAAVLSIQNSLLTRGWLQG